MISPELLEILRCPATMQRLAFASASVLEKIETDALRDRSGKLAGRLAGGLVREDGTVLYPIRDGIPILLVDEAIALPDSAIRSDPSQARGDASQGDIEP